MLPTLWAIVLIALVAVIVIKALPFRRLVIFEYQRGLKYRNGRYQETLMAGQYWIFPPTTHIATVDVRPQLVTIPGQEVISADGVTLKISIAAEYEVADPATAVNKNANHHAAFYLVLQMAVREIVGREKVDAVVENRASIGGRIGELTRDKIASLGLRLISADIKDVMLPGELRRTFSQVVKAQKEGLAALERARGESAALRNLANAAKMMDDNPNLLQLRALQTLGDSTGNTILFGVPAAAGPMVKRSNGRQEPAEEAGQE
jgi:regulator of protease activity HflC (stomatin/prohibitin superfamily)